MAALARARLQTPRLWLRPVAPSDEAAVVAALNHIAVTGWLAVVPYPYSARDFASFQMAYAVPGETFAVDDDEGFVGIIGVEDRTLGYWIAPHRHGLGYATEAAVAFWPSTSRKTRPLSLPATSRAISGRPMSYASWDLSKQGAI